jgi:nitrite reductase/ring-hydroxylating ferredoxin subunit/mono/diheme cytochrome c family protein
MLRFGLLVPLVLLAAGSLLFASASAGALPLPQAALTPTFDPARLAQPPTIFPPAQADNGAQVYWGMCMDCHGDRGQGLTEEWRNSFTSDQRDCWQSGCHGADYPANSFEIPQAGVPAIAGNGTLGRFGNAAEMQAFIQDAMPLFPPGSLTSEQAWSLTAYVLRLNGWEAAGLTLGPANSAAIPIQGRVEVPTSGIPGVVTLAGVLALALVGLGLHAARQAGSPARLARRDFLKLAANSLLGLSGALGLGGLARYFSFRPNPGPPRAFDLGRAAAYPEGSRTLRPDIPAVIYNRSGEISAYSLTCTHLGCTLEADGQEFACPCHGSRFDQDGRVLAGPAQAPLRRLRMEALEDGTLILYTDGD